VFVKIGSIGETDGSVEMTELMTTRSAKPRGPFLLRRGRNGQ
jgi:hypothetical protein